MNPCGAPKIKVLPSPLRAAERPTRSSAPASLGSNFCSLANSVAAASGSNWISANRQARLVVELICRIWVTVIVHTPGTRSPTTTRLSKQPSMRQPYSLPSTSTNRSAGSVNVTARGGDLPRTAADTDPRSSLTDPVRSWTWTSTRCCMAWFGNARVRQASTSRSSMRASNAAATAGRTRKPPRLAATNPDARVQRVVSATMRLMVARVLA